MQKPSSNQSIIINSKRRLKRPQVSAAPLHLLLLTHPLMVSSVWFAWSKCPPLHPCCHRGNQLGWANNLKRSSVCLNVSFLSSLRAFAPLLLPHPPTPASPSPGFRSVSGDGSPPRRELAWISDPHTHASCCCCRSAPLPPLICQPFPHFFFLVLPASSCPHVIAERCCHWFYW